MVALYCVAILGMTVQETVRSVLSFHESSGEPPKTLQRLHTNDQFPWLQSIESVTRTRGVKYNLSPASSIRWDFVGELFRRQSNMEAAGLASRGRGEQRGRQCNENCRDNGPAMVSSVASARAGPPVTAADPLWLPNSDPWLKCRPNVKPLLAMPDMEGRRSPRDVAESLASPQTEVSQADLFCGAEDVNAPLLNFCLARSPATSLFTPTWVVPNFSLFLRWLWKESCRLLLHRPELHQSPDGSASGRAFLTPWQQLENMVHRRTNTSLARPRKRGSEKPGQEYLLLHFSWWPTWGEHHEIWATLFTRLSMALLHMWERTDTRLQFQHRFRGQPGAWTDVLSVGFRYEWRDSVTAIRCLSRDPRFYALQRELCSYTLSDHASVPMGTPLEGRRVPTLGVVPDAHAADDHAAFLALLCSEHSTDKTRVDDDSRYPADVMRMVGPPSSARGSVARYLRVKNSITRSVDDLESCALLLPSESYGQRSGKDIPNIVAARHALNPGARSRLEHGIVDGDDRVLVTVKLSFRVHEASRRFFASDPSRLESSRHKPSLLSCITPTSRAVSIAQDVILDTENRAHRGGSPTSSASQIPSSQSVDDSLPCSPRSLDSDSTASSESDGSDSDHEWNSFVCFRCQGKEFPDEDIWCSQCDAAISPEDFAVESGLSTCMSLVQAVQAMEESETHTKYRRAIIEVCCGAQSQLSRARLNVTDDCFCFRVTQADDFTLDSIVDAIIAVLHIFGKRALVWFSIPCTGGCFWQCINCKRSTRARRRMKGHLSLFRQLWSSLERVVEEASQVESRVAIEWPKSCRYWTRKEVQAILRKKAYELRTGTFHGCQFGLVSISKRFKGVPILKPWRVETNCGPLTETLDRQCYHQQRNGTHDGSTRHAPRAGVDTQATEGYTDKMVIAIHKGHRQYVASLPTSM